MIFYWESLKTDFLLTSASIGKNKYIPVPSAETFWPKPEKRASKTDESNQNEEVKPLYVPEGQKDHETAVAYLRRTNQELSDVFEKTVLFKKYGVSFPFFMFVFLIFFLEMK